MPLLATAVATLFLLTADPGGAEPGGAEPEPSASAPEQRPPSEGPKQSSVRSPGDTHALGVKGRVGLRHSEVRALDRPLEKQTEVSRARVEVDYRYARLLRAVLEVEVSEGPQLLDAFVRAGGKGFAVRVGNLKPPLSGMELESSWRLPLARRGIVHNALVDHMRFAGRRPGVQLEWRGDHLWKPQVTAGAFQGSDTRGRLFRSIGVLETHLSARAKVEPGKAELGLSGALVGTEALAGIGIGRYWMGALDAAARGRVGPLRLRGWAEALYGVSFYGAEAFGRDTPFAGGRAVGAARLWGAKDDHGYLELFALAEQLRFDLSAPDSDLRGLVAGVNAGFWDRLRITFQAERREGGARAPYLSAGGNQLRDRTVFLVQVESRLEGRWAR